MSRKLALLAVLPLIAACKTTTPIAATDTFLSGRVQTSNPESCLAYEPIRYSRSDTAETRRQIIEHNAAFDALCKAQGPQASAANKRAK